MHAGHFITRVRASTMFDERNVRPQCMMCNMFRGGESGIFAQKLIRELGQEEFDDLCSKSHTLHQFTQTELLNIIDKYSKK